jgi:uncharacterized protein with PIN domain
VNETAAAIEARTDEVARRAVELMLEAAPSDAAALDARGRRLCEEDAGLHVRALVGSVAAGDPTIFGDYAVWAAELLSRFGIAAEHLAALLRATSRAIDELAPSAAGAVQPHLDAGERALVR